MGSGKTQWSIQYINENQYDNILYITPFLKEVDRIITSTNRSFKQPLNKGEGKLQSINDLLEGQEDITCTHELFKHLNEESKQRIKEGHYTLILDEVLNVIEPYDDVKQNDMDLLKNSGCVTVDDEGYIIWNEDKKDYDTKYNEIRDLAQNRSLIYINQKLLLWKYPPDIFTLFDKIYVLTYLFEASILKHYFDLYEFQYEKKSVIKKDDSYAIVDYFVPDTTQFKERVNIYEGILNDNFNQKLTSLSKTWFNAKTNTKTQMKIKNNIYNYFQNIVKAPASSILWTTFKAAKSKLKGKGYSSKFLACNCRATNEYDEAYNLAYCVNIYLHPAVTQFFYQKNINVDEDLYALSEMLQFIWRSAIRKGEEINIYIPSIRMRNLLINWLNMSLNNQALKVA